MIPVWAVVQLDAESGRRLRFRLPLLLLWLALLPLAIVLLPLLLLWCLVRSVNPLPPIRAVLSVLASVSGTHVEIQHGHASVLVRIV